MKLITILFLLVANYSLSQLVGVNEEKSKSIVKDTNSWIYLDAGYFIINHTLESNPDFLNKPLGERANESKINLWSYSLGMSVPIAKNIYFDGGLSFIQNGETYSWQSNSNDSSFKYDTKYRYIGMPLQLKYQTGKNFIFYVGGGVIPQMLMVYVQSQSWTDSLGSKDELKVKNYNNLNSFVLSAIATTGFILKFDNNFGIRLAIQYRTQLTDSYSKFNGYLHKTSALGFTFGLTRKF